MSLEGPLAAEALAEALEGGGGAATASPPPPHCGLPLLPSPWPQAAAAAGGELPLKGLRIGVYDKWFDHASPAVVAACRAALAVLERCGAAVQPVVVPELEALRVAHSVTILSEMLHNFKERYDTPSLRSAFNADVRLALANARFWSPADYLQAQRIRARANVHFRRVLGQVHMIATPATPAPAPRIHPDALTGGESNLRQVSVVMRFMVAPNMLGLPAISLPVGMVPAEEDSPAAAAAGGGGGVMLPAGLQLIGRPLAEATLLRAGAVLEAALAKERQEAGPVGPAGTAGTAGTAGAGAAAVQSRCVPPLRLNPLTGERRGL
ncbi:hypothetical protein GPECTOR_121g430 [Gonium pectorale]|uniref:Amidase domain-containing protein n=1 Tax=Gonium pectorale TaxID=33097 RepID=A0A150G084_GONPE|nr:hypothetical protein GPECTOR_121g430 [Gonium pectorale]|eukprot:KXZ42730.1 hypothetical protein GPECTOR_121g430 [Gonium pectorale]